MDISGEYYSQGVVATSSVATVSAGSAAAAAALASVAAARAASATPGTTAVAVAKRPRVRAVSRGAAGEQQHGVKDAEGQVVTSRRFGSSYYSLHQRDRDMITSAAPISDVCSEAMFRLVLDPHNYGAANLAAQESHRHRGDGIERFATVQRLFNRCTDSVAACLLHAHESAARRRYSDALDRYLDGFILDPAQPLTALCVCSLMIFFAHHYLVGQRLQVLLKGLAFLQQYQHSRRAHRDRLSEATTGSSSSSSGSGSGSGESKDGENKDEEGNGEGEDSAEMEVQEVEDATPAGPAVLIQSVRADGLEQEILFNTGRALQELKLFALAARCYEDALALADTHPEWLEHSASSSASLHVTEASAHNLACILRRSGNMDQALTVMRKYLSY
jgi:tetratricopeptide (TPR) repeat protein